MSLSNLSISFDENHYFKYSSDYSGFDEENPTTLGQNVNYSDFVKLFKENKELIKVAYQKDLDKSLIQSSKNLFHDLHKIVELCKIGQYQNIHSIIHFIIQSYQNLEKQNKLLFQQNDKIFKELQELKKQMKENKKQNYQLHQSLQSSIHSLEEQIKQLHNDLSSYRHENQNNIDKYKFILHDYNELQQKYNEMEEKNTIIFDVKNQLLHLQSSYESSKTCIQTLQQENKEKDEKNKEMMKMIEESQKILKKELQIKKQMEENYNEKIEKKQKKWKELDEEYCLLKQTLKSNKQEMTLMAERILDMENCISIQKEVNKKLGVTVRDKSHQIGKLMKEIIFKEECSIVYRDSTYLKIIELLTKEFSLAMLIAYRNNDIEDLMMRLNPLQKDKAREFTIFIESFDDKYRRFIIPNLNYIIQAGMHTCLKVPNTYPEKFLSLVPEGEQNANKQSWYFMSSNGLYVLKILYDISTKKYEIKNQNYYRKICYFMKRLTTDIILDWEEDDIIDAIQIILDLIIHIKDLDCFMEEFKLWISFFRDTMKMNSKLESRKLIKPFDIIQIKQ